MEENKDRNILLARSVHEGPVYYSCTTYFKPATDSHDDRVVCEINFTADHVFNIILSKHVITIQNSVTEQLYFFNNNYELACTSRPFGIFEHDINLVGLAFTGDSIITMLSCSREFERILREVLTNKNIGITEAINKHFNLRECPEI